MQKGKLGFSLWFYPIVALWCIILEQFVPLLLVTGFVMAVEKDAWAIKQCMTALMFNIYYTLYIFIMDFFIAIPLLGFVFMVIDFIIWLVLVIIIIIGFGKVKNGGDIGLPGKGLANQVFGIMPQQHAPQQPQQAYQGQYQQPQQPYQGQYQQPQGGYTQQPQQPQQPYQNYNQQQNNQPPQQ